MYLNCFNVLWVYLFYSCLVGFRLDTGRLPFTLIIKLFPTYIKEFDYYQGLEYDPQRDRQNKIYFLSVPYLLDFMYIKEL